MLQTRFQNAAIDIHEEQEALKGNKKLFTGLNVTVVQVYAVQYDNEQYTNKDSPGLRNFQT